MNLPEIKKPNNNIKIYIYNTDAGYFHHIT